MSAFDVFISYNGQDRQLVLKLAEALKERGLKVWLDVWIVKPGERWIYCVRAKNWNILAQLKL
jgi:hypothetical protein